MSHKLTFLAVVALAAITMFFPVPAHAGTLSAGELAKIKASAGDQSGCAAAQRDYVSGFKTEAQMRAACGGGGAVCNKNGVKDNGESGVDCGGGGCGRCGGHPPPPTHPTDFGWVIWVWLGCLTAAVVSLWLRLGGAKEEARRQTARALADYHRQHHAPDPPAGHAAPPAGGGHP